MPPQGANRKLWILLFTHCCRTKRTQRALHSYSCTLSSAQIVFVELKFHSKFNNNCNRYNIQTVRHFLCVVAGRIKYAFFHNFYEAFIKKREEIVLVSLKLTMNKERGKIKYTIWSPIGKNTLNKAIYVCAPKKRKKMK